MSLLSCHVGPITGCHTGCAVLFIKYCPPAAALVPYLFSALMAVVWRSYPSIVLTHWSCPPTLRPTLWVDLPRHALARLGTLSRAFTTFTAFRLFMVWWATVLGDLWQIPPETMGLTFLAAGTSVPDLITSVLVARVRAECCSQHSVFLCLVAHEIVVWRGWALPASHLWQPPLPGPAPTACLALSTSRYITVYYRPAAPPLPAPAPTACLALSTCRYITVYYRPAGRVHGRDRCVNVCVFTAVSCNLRV